MSDSIKVIGSLDTCGKVEIAVSHYEHCDSRDSHYCITKEQARQLIAHLNTVFQLGADLTVMEQDS